jgi:hypothetical protein
MFPPVHPYWPPDAVTDLLADLRQRLRDCTAQDDSDADTDNAFFRAPLSPAVSAFLEAPAASLPLLYADKRLLAPALMNALLRHWTVSPARAAPRQARSLPATLVIAGSREVLVGDSVNLVEIALETHDRAPRGDGATTGPSGDDSVGVHVHERVGAGAVDDAVSQGEVQVDELDEPAEAEAGDADTEASLWEGVEVVTPDYSGEYDKNASVKPIYVHTHINKTRPPQAGAESRPRTAPAVGSKLHWDSTKTSVPMRLYVYPGLFHVFPLSPFLPETKHALGLVQQFAMGDCGWGAEDEGKRE